LKLVSINSQERYSLVRLFLIYGFPDTTAPSGAVPALLDFFIVDGGIIGFGPSAFFILSSTGFFAAGLVVTAG
jgi:hypothetical protein